MKNWLKKILGKVANCMKNDNAGMGVIEVILIMVVIIGLVVIFKTQITSLVKTLMNNLQNGALSI